MFLDFFFTLLVGFFGGLFYRMRGGMKPHLPRPIDQMLFCIIFLLPLSVLDIRWALLGYAVSVVVVLRGHGRNMDLGRNLNADYQPEWYEDFIAFLQPRLNEKDYDFIGLVVSGLSVSLAPGLLLAAGGHVLPGLLIAVSGALKGPAYAIGWMLDGIKTGIAKGGTEWGEFLTGFFIWIFVFLVAVSFAPDVSGLLKG